MVNSQKYYKDKNYYDFIKIKTYNYNSKEFKDMMKLNNFSLLLTHDFVIDPITNEYEFKGDIIDFVYQK